MSHPDNERWQQCWRDRAIDFHQKTVNPLLVRYWPQLGLAPTDKVFVPLCGKSRDLLWLHQQGHAVTGVELSPIAARAFFKESKLQAQRSRVGDFTQWQHHELRIFCGDFFNLTSADLLGVKAVYDRASLTALPEDVRVQYLAHLLAILPADCSVLLLTIEDVDDDESDEESQAISQEITELYGAGFKVVLEHVESLLEASPDSAISEPIRVVHKAYLMTPKVLLAAA